MFLMRVKAGQLCYIKMVLSNLDIKDAVLAGFSMGGAIAVRYVSVYKGAHVSKLALIAAAAPIWTQRKDILCY